MPEQSNDDEPISAEEARRRGDEVLRRLHRMPPKPQEDMKLGKGPATKQGSDQSPSKDKHL